MANRDSRSRPPAPARGREHVREPTQSLDLDALDLGDDDLDDAEISHPSLALGTHEKREQHTRIESPAAQRRTPAPPEPIAPRPASDVRAPNARRPTTVSVGEDPELRLGAVLGSYRLTQLLGKGGMGYVYRAEHVKLGREVALKLLRSDYARRRDAVARFFQEARTVNRVRHRNIVDVTDFVELDDGTTFIIMELLSGVALGKWARTGIDLPRALAVLVQICDGLGAAHAVGVIHRDLKPDNVIVVPTADGAELVKLLDFGVAKLLNRDDEDVGVQTQAGSVIGTPAYMSPEQAGGMDIDHRSDIYSLGAIMYELFCGQPMFRGRSFGEYVRKHLSEVPPAPHATPGGKDLDPRIEAMILRCLEKDPARRPQHILALRDELLALLGGDLPSATYSAIHHSSAIRAALPPAAAPLAHVTTIPSGPYGHQSQVVLAPIPSLANMQAPAPASPWWVWAGGGAIAIGIGIAAALWYAGRTPDSGARPPVVPAAVAAPSQASVPPGNPVPPSAPAATAVEVRFDSLPAASVFADGRSAELCRTPCTVRVDLADGGAADQRAFVLRAEGYVDKTVLVDLTAAHPELHATLEHVAQVTPTVPRPVGPPVHAGASHAPPKLEAKKPEPEAKSEPKSEPKKPEPEAKSEPKSDVKPDPKPEPKKPEPHRATDTIDQSETLDPFRQR